jgi:hypothetical protein
VDTGVQQTVEANQSGFYTFSRPGLDIVTYDIYSARWPEKTYTGLSARIKPIQRDNL